MCRVIWQQNILVFIAICALPFERTKRQHLLHWNCSSRSQNLRRRHAHGIDQSCLPANLCHHLQIQCRRDLGIKMSVNCTFHAKKAMWIYTHSQQGITVNIVLYYDAIQATWGGICLKIVHGEGENLLGLCHGELIENIVAPLYTVKTITNSPKCEIECFYSLFTFSFNTAGQYNKEEDRVITHISL